MAPACWISSVPGWPMISCSSMSGSRVGGGTMPSLSAANCARLVVLVRALTARSATGVSVKKGWANRNGVARGVRPPERAVFFALRFAVFVFLAVFAFLAISISSGNKLSSNSACHRFEKSKSADPIAPLANQQRPAAPALSRRRLCAKRSAGRDRPAELISNTPRAKVALMKPIGVGGVDDAVERMSFDIEKFPHQVEPVKHVHIHGRRELVDQRQHALRGADLVVGEHGGRILEVHHDDIHRLAAQ